MSLSKPVLYGAGAGIGSLYVLKVQPLVAAAIGAAVWYFLSKR